VSRLLFQLSGVEAAGGFLLLLLGRHWYYAFVPWALAAGTYLLARRAARRESA
jgi:hypothetical protein